MKTLYTSFLVMGALLISTSDAHAYLDPATGTIIVQALLALFVGTVTVVKVFWYKIKNLFSKSETEEAEKPLDDLEKVEANVD